MKLFYCQSSSNDLGLLGITYYATSEFLYYDKVKLLLEKISVHTSLFNSETILLCQVCNAIAQGYMQPWIPALPPPPPPTAAATPSKDKSEKTEKVKGRQSGKGARGGQSKGSLQTVTVDPEATPDLKQALDVRVTFFL